LVIERHCIRHQRTWRLPLVLATVLIEKMIFQDKKTKLSFIFFRFTIKAKVEFYYILEMKRPKYHLSTFLFYFLKLKVIKLFNYLKWFKNIYIPLYNHQIINELCEKIKIPKNQGLWFFFWKSKSIITV